jgi:hypothetical protein
MELSSVFRRLAHDEDPLGELERPPQAARSLIRLFVQESEAAAPTRGATQPQRHQQGFY